MLGNHRKFFGRNRNCSDSFAGVKKAWEQIWGSLQNFQRTPAQLSRPSNGGKVVEYSPLHTAEYASALLASDWLYFLWGGWDKKLYTSFKSKPHVLPFSSLRLKLRLLSPFILRTATIIVKSQAGITLNES